MGNQGAEKCWNRHCQSKVEGDADYNIPDLSSTCFTMPHFDKKAGEKLWESIHGEKRKKTDLYTYKCIQPYTAIKGSTQMIFCAWKMFPGNIRR